MKAAETHSKGGVSAAKRQWKRTAKAVSQPRKAVEKHGNGGVSAANRKRKLKAKAVSQP